MTTQMFREIAEQPQAIATTLPILRSQRSALADLARGRRRVLFVARGSSDNAAVYGRYLLETHSGVSAAMAAPSVATHYHAKLDLSDALVVSVSQSGATAEIVTTQAWARECGAATVAVTNVAGSPLAESADLALVTYAGPEKAVPATKTYSTQLLAMAILGGALSPDPTALDAGLDRVADEISRLVDQRAGVEEAAALLASSEHSVVTGRGLLMGTALEVALKMEETCLRPVRGYSYADLRHGPISVVGPGIVAVLLCANDGPLVEPLRTLAHDLRNRGAQVVSVGGPPEFAAAGNVAVAGPDLPEVLAPLALIAPAQLISERLSRLLGLDPDAPRGLNKVTQTDTKARTA